MFMFLFFNVAIFLTIDSNDSDWKMELILAIFVEVILIIVWLILIKVIKNYQNITWENLNDGTVFKILKIGATFDKSIKPSKKTGYLEIQTKGVKKILMVFPTHISCWEGIKPNEGKSYKKDGNYFTEIRFF